MKRIFAVLNMLLLMAAALRAQTNVAQTIGQTLLIEPSARISAMGNAGSAIRTEPMAAFYNPAAVGAVTNAGLQMTHSNWLLGTTYDYAIASIPFGNGSAMMLNVASFRSGDIAVRTVDLEHGTGEYYSANDVAFGKDADDLSVAIGDDKRADAVFRQHPHRLRQLLVGT